VTKKAVKAAPAKHASSKTSKPVQKKVAAKPASKKVVKVASKPAKAVVKVAPKVAASSKVVVSNKSKSVKPVIKTPDTSKKTVPPVIKKTEVKKAEVKAAPVKVAPPKPSVMVKAKDIKVPAPKPVAIPKITTKTVRKYQPEFTKSVLDKAQRDPGAPTQRYSDAELLEFRELIVRKLDAAKKELNYLHGLITRKDDMGGDETDNRYMTMEDGSLSMEREQLSQMASRQITFIDHLEKAMMRIENKTYGICRVTGKLIDKARLRAVPHATLSMEAKMGSVK
jgi:RNA polymerase-binding transcription factor DksA